VIVPITQKQAKQFIARVHRHNIASISSVFNVGIAESFGAELLGVAMCGIPKARLLMDGLTLEVTRTCVKEGTKNGNSMLYGACARAASALGYKRLITYTLPSEGGASLRASGWQKDDGEYGGDIANWNRHSLTGHAGRTIVDMFGAERMPPGPKWRWTKCL